jgi:hypothetical protein
VSLHEKLLRDERFEQPSGLIRIDTLSSARLGDRQAQAGHLAVLVANAFGEELGVQVSHVETGSF